MAIYVGTISYKGSRRRPAGFVDEIKGATDDELIAKAFGKSLTRVIGRDGKTRMVNLFSHNKPIVYIDKREVHEINDIKFLATNTSSILDWQAVGIYMMLVHQEYLAELFAGITQEALGHPTNQMVIALTKCLFGAGSPDDVRMIYKHETEKRDINIQRYKDSVGRFLMSRREEIRFKRYGMNFRGQVCIKHYECNFDKDKIKIQFKLVGFNVAGNKSAISGVSDKTMEIRQFDFFKKKSLLMNGKALTFVHALDGFTISEIYREMLKNRVVPEIKRQIQKSKATEAGLSAFSSFNCATAYDELWDKLKFCNADIPQKGIKENDLRHYEKGKFSLNDIIEKYNQSFVKRMHTALRKRYRKYASLEAYADRALSGISGGKQNYELRESAIFQANQILSEYSETLDKISDFSELLIQYNAPKKEHDQEIIKHIQERLADRKHGILSSSKNEQDRKAVKFNEILVEMVMGYWSSFIKRHNIDSNSQLNQHIDELFINKELHNRWIEFERLRQNGVLQSVEQYVRSIKPEFMTFINENYDFDKAVDCARKQLLNGLAEKELPVNTKKELCILVPKLIHDFTTACRYGGNKKGVDAFIERSKNMRNGKSTSQYDEKLIGKEIINSLEDKLGISLEFKGVSKEIITPRIRSVVSKQVKRNLQQINQITKNNDELALDAEIQITVFQMSSEIKKIVEDGEKRVEHFFVDKCQKINGDTNIKADGLLKYIHKCYPQKALLYLKIKPQSLLRDYLKYNHEKKALQNKGMLEPAIIEGFNSYLKEAGLNLHEFTERTNVTISKIVADTSKKLRSKWSAVMKNNPSENVVNKIRNDIDFQDDFFAEYLVAYAETKDKEQIKSKLEDVVIAVLDQHFLTEYLFAKVTGITVGKATNELLLNYINGTPSPELIEPMLRSLLVRCEEYTAEYVKDLIREQYGEISNLNEVSNYRLDNNRVACGAMTIEEYISKHYSTIN